MLEVRSSTLLLDPMQAGTWSKRSMSKLIAETAKRRRQSSVMKSGKKGSLSGLLEKGIESFRVLDSDGERTQQQKTTNPVNLTDFGDKFICIEARNNSSCCLEDAPSHSNWFNHDDQPKNMYGNGVLDEDEIDENSEGENVINKGPACRPGVVRALLSCDKVLAKQRVDAMLTTGMTAGHLGTRSAWQHLSPKWKDVWLATSKPKKV